MSSDSSDSNTIVILFFLFWFFATTSTCNSTGDTEKEVRESNTHMEKVEAKLDTLIKYQKQWQENQQRK